MQPDDGITASILPEHDIIWEVICILKEGGKKKVESRIKDKKSIAENDGREHKLKNLQKNETNQKMKVKDCIQAGKQK